MNRKGFTLLELIVSLAIFTMITGGLWRMLKGGTLAFVRAQQQSAVVDSGERALRGFQQQKGILKDIRCCTGVKDLQGGTLSLTGPAGGVKYFLQGTSLMRAVSSTMTVTAATTTLAGDVTALSFRYFSVNNGLISIATAAVTVDSVEVHVHVKKGDTDYDQLSSAGFRNNY